MTSPCSQILIASGLNYVFCMIFYILIGNKWAYYNNINKKFIDKSMKKPGCTNFYTKKF